MEYYPTDLIVYVDDISVHTELDMVEVVDEDLFEFIEVNAIRSFHVAFAPVEAFCIEPMIEQYEKLMRHTRPLHIKLTSDQGEMKDRVDELIEIGKREGTDSFDLSKFTGAKPTVPMRRLVLDVAISVPFGVTHLKCDTHRIGMNLKDVVVLDRKSWVVPLAENKVETLIVRRTKVNLLEIDGSWYPCLKNLMGTEIIQLKGNFPLLEHAQGIDSIYCELPSIKSLHIAAPINSDPKPYFERFPTLEMIRFGLPQDTFITHRRNKQDQSLLSFT